MALSDFTPESRPVVVNGKALFNVAGLSLDSLAVLVRTHMPDLEAIFDMVMVEGLPDEGWGEHLARISTGLASQAPGLVANIIVTAQVDEPVSEQLIGIARRLPFPVQVEALTNIGALTFDEAGGVKKAVESLLVMLSSLRGKVPTPKNQHSSEPTSESAAT
jgi:hypothetical protein